MDIVERLRAHAHRASSMNEDMEIEAADTIERLRAENKAAWDSAEHNAKRARAAEATISRLREYAEHTTGCDSWAWPGGMKKPHAKCDCGYDALIAELEESK